MTNDRQHLDRLTASFYDAFTSSDGRVPNIDALYGFFTPEARIVKNAGSSPETYDVKTFVEPRRALLTSGTIAEFREEETADDTRIFGNVAQRLSLYRKSWLESGVRKDGRGVKTVQFVRTRDGWRISALAWDDERDGFTVPGDVPAEPVRVPVIETQRLILRGHRADDLADCVAMWADPMVTRYIGGKPSTEQQTWTRVLTYAGLWSFLGYGYWAIEEKATGAFAGEIGFADFHRNVGASMRNVPELGWALAVSAHGRGLATEAASAALAWLDGTAERRTVCMIDAENAASINVAGKIGFREFERTTFADRPAIFFERLRP